MLDVKTLNRTQRVQLDRFLKIRKEIKDLTVFWKKNVRPSLISQAKQVFDTKGFGEWPPRKDQKKKHPLMRLSDRLYNSWTKTGAEGNIFRFGKLWMEWGSNVFYGIIHELGGPIIPKRAIGEIIATKSKTGKTLDERLTSLLIRHLLRVTA